MSTGPYKPPPRKEWNSDAAACGIAIEDEGYESADYVDGWNTALDAVEQTVFEDMLRSLAEPSTEVSSPIVHPTLIQSSSKGVT